MDKRFWAIIGMIIVIFGGIIVANNNKQENPGGTSGKASQTTNHYAGKLDSKVTFTEYGDYQCSACKSFYPITKQVKEKYGDRVRFQFRNLPLTSLHPNAFAGARAAEAADVQGKFWEMHDLLYENQDPSGQTGWVASKDPLSDYFVKYAEKLGLNTTTFKKDFGSTVVNTRINADLDAFKATKEDLSTPTFFINGKKVNSSLLLDNQIQPQPSLEAFSKVLDEALASTQ
ncbi:thioredoxin domain-containing protein [Candidatus Saccharibacteria bacterium]|nr:MAG: thioredoxin domain-containing protein [Candidatus Saccharibacteria bacterium]